MNNKKVRNIAVDLDNDNWATIKIRLYVFNGDADTAIDLAIKALTDLKVQRIKG